MSFTITWGQCKGNEAKHRGSVDNPAACFVATLVGRMRLLLEELLDGILTTKEDSTRVYGNTTVKKAHIRLVQTVRLVPVGGFGGDAGIVDHDVEAAAPLHSLLYERLDVLFLAHVALYEGARVFAVFLLENLVSRFGQLFSDGFACVWGEICTGSSQLHSSVTSWNLRKMEQMLIYRCRRLVPPPRHSALPLLALARMRSQ